MRPLTLTLVVLLVACSSPTAPDGDYRCDATVYAESLDVMPDSIFFYNCRGGDDERSE